MLVTGLLFCFLCAVPTVSLAASRHCTSIGEASVIYIFIIIIIIIIKSGFCFDELKFTSAREKRKEKENNKQKTPKIYNA